jgi:hypothetical protein
MAAKVFFSVSMSLDGFVAPNAVPAEDLFSSPEKQDDPRVRQWMSQWSELHAWLLPQRFTRENFDLELIETRTLDGRTQELIYRPTLHV